MLPDWSKPPKLLIVCGGRGILFNERVQSEALLLRGNGAGQHPL